MGATRWVVAELYTGDVDPVLAVRVLGSPEKVVEGLPFVVGMRGGRVRLQFRRALIGFSDTYTVAASPEGEGGARIVLEGERSSIEILVEADRGERMLRARARYEGPRAWVVRARLPWLARGLMEYAEEEARRLVEARRARAGGLAALLASAGGVARIVARSRLLGSAEWRAETGPEGLVEAARSVALASRYPVLYVGGSGPGVVVRAVIAGGRVVAAYAKTPRGERLGGPEALEGLRGAARLRVYGVLSPLERLAEARG